jgi:hypothetical protein
MMGSVSRPNGARATCPSMVTGQRSLWIGALLGSLRDGHLHRPNRRRLSACADICTIEPRLDVAALPDSLAGALSLALSFVMPALRVLGQSNARPFCTSHSPRSLAATEQVATVRPYGSRLTGTQLMGRRSMKAAAQLAAFRCIDAPTPDAHAMHFRRVAVDHAGLSDKNRRPTPRSTKWQESLRQRFGAFQ